MSVDYFTKKVVFRKLGFLELEFEGDCRILLTCVISALEAKRLLHKCCEAYLAHVIDTSTSKVTLKSGQLCESSRMYFSRIYQGCHQIEDWNLILTCCRDQLSFLYHHIGWPQLN